MDHAGHKFGPSHSEMRRKLTEMNKVIKETVEKMPNDCVLFVMGDHGMTESGDHGGDSENELNAAMFIYSHRWKEPIISEQSFNKSKVRIFFLIFILF